jgi:hypothetical protein
MPLSNPVFASLLTLICLSSPFAQASFESVAETEQQYVATEREWVRRNLGFQQDPDNQSIVIGNMPEAKNPTARELKARAIQELRQLNCSPELYSELRSQLQWLTQQNAGHQGLYSSIADFATLSSWDGVNNKLLTRQELIEPFAEKFFDGSRQFDPCEVGLRTSTQTSPVQMHAFFLNYGYQCTARRYKTESDDPVLQNMLAYGPTEGSAPL